MLKINKRKFVLSLFALSISVGASMSAIGLAYAQDALKNIMASKTIKIGIPTDFPPYGFVGPDLKPQGLDVDMANYIAQKMGVKLDLIVVTSPNRIPYLQTKRADLVISTLGKNPEREKVIDFTSAYSPYFQAVFGPKTLNVKSFDDLTGKSIAVTRGALEDQEITKLAPAGVDIKRFEDNNATVSAYVSGQVKLIATGVSVAESMMQRTPQQGTEYKLLIKDSPNFVGVAKGEDELRLKVNEIIAQAAASGELDRLSEKWLKRPAGNLPK